MLIKVREIPDQNDVPEDEQKLKVYLQGAPEDVLALCLNYTITGESCPFAQDESNILMEQISNKMGKEGIVPISFASKEITKAEFNELEK